jgi:hypothetical protein
MICNDTDQVVVDLKIIGNKIGNIKEVVPNVKTMFGKFWGNFSE